MERRPTDGMPMDASDLPIQLEQAQRRAAQLERLADASRRIAALSTLELEELLDEVLDLIQESFDYKRVRIFLLQEDRLVFRAGRGGRAVRWAIEGLSYTLEDAAPVALAARTGQAVLLQDMPSSGEADEIRAEMAAPMLLDTGATRPIGVLDVQSEEPGAFGDEDVQTLQALAETLAVAVHTARLFASERRQRRRAETLRQASAALGSTLEIDAVLDRVLGGLAQIVGYDAAAVLWVNETGELTLRRVDLRGRFALQERSILAGLTEGALDLPLSVKRFPSGEPLPSVIPLGEFDPWEEYQSLAQRLGLAEPHVGLAAVLAVRGEHAGYLVVDRAGQNAFAPEEVGALAAFAAPAATAIENAFLYTAQHEEAWVSTALLQVAEATAQAAELDDMVKTVARLTPILVGVDRCAVLLADEDSYTLSAYHNTNADKRETRAPAPDLGESLASGSDFALSPLSRSDPNFLDSLDNPLSTFEPPPRILASEWPALLEMQATRQAVVMGPEERTLMPPALQPLFDGVVTLLPLSAKGRLQGALVVGQAPGETPFTPHRIRLLGGIANHVALAIESALLAQSQQEEAWVSMALLQVAQAVAWQPTLEAGLETVARLIPILVGIEKAAIYRWQEAAQTFGLGQCVGWEETAAAALAQHLATATPLWSGADEPSGLPFRLELPERLAAAFAAEACTVLPLRARGSLLGALVVESVAALGRRMSILNGIAHQLAVAMENAQLAQEIMQQQRLEREVEMARSIQVSFLPECCPTIVGLELAAFWRSARQVGGDFYDFIPLAQRRGRDEEERWGIAIADVADKGVPAALFMALSKTLLRAVAISRVSPGATLARVNELLLADARTDLFVTVFYGVWEPKAGRLRYAVGGHNQPIWVGRKGSVQTLVGQGIALGVVDYAEYEDHEIRLNPGDTLLLFTDGVTDALNREGEEFGMSRLMDVTRQSATSRAERSITAEDVLQAIAAAVQAHVGAMEAFDDMTMVVLKRTAPPA